MGGRLPPESASLMVLGHPQCQLISATGEQTSDGFDAPDSLDAPGSPPPYSFGRKAAVLSGSANPASSVCFSERAWTPAWAGVTILPKTAAGRRDMQRIS